MMSRLTNYLLSIPSVANLMQRPAARQLLRYALGGFCVTQIAAAVYSALVIVMTTHPLLANSMSTAFGLALGYIVHSRWSFAAVNDGEGLQVARFLLASAIAFAINSFWVWLLVIKLGMSPLAPVPMMMLVTPWLSFLLNRHWVFRAA